MSFARTDPAPVVSRFSRYFPFSHWAVKNVWLLLPVFAFAAFVFGSFSVHYGLSVMCIWMGLVCFWVDRKHLDYCLFTPLQPAAVVLIMGLGAGISMVTLDAPETFEYGYFVMQMAGLLGFPIFMAGYYLVTRKVPGFVFPRWVAGTNQQLIRPLIFAGWCCLLYEFAKVVAGVVSGVSDRGYAGDFQIDTPFGWWSVFSVFIRVQTLGFILVPLIWRESRAMGRTMVAGVVIAILFLHFVAASRGAVFFPLFIMLVGSYMFLESKRLKYEVLICLGVIGLAPFVTLMANYRSTQAFRETDIRNVFQKVGTIREGLQREESMENESGQRYTESGLAFIGVADQLVYEMTPDPVPFEGFGRLGDAVWTIVPFMFTRGERPILQDGYTIVVGYTGFRGERTSIGISLPAELYRRWGWLGMPIGLFIYGLFYGGIFRYAYRCYLFKNALWGFMMCGLLFNFFVAWFWASILTMTWYWFYDIPKHLLLLAALYWAAKIVYNVQKVPGALALMAPEEALSGSSLRLPGPAFARRRL